MKKTILILIIGLLLFAVNLYAGDGDLLVTGKVGIGTETPTNALDVVGIGSFENGSFSTTIGALGELRVKNTASTARVRLVSGNASYGAAIRLQNGNGDVWDLKLDSNDVLSLANYDVDLIFFKDDGSVGIGTSNPQSKLAVAGLPTTPPGGAQTAGVLCVTVNGDIWIDNDGTYDCQ